MNLTPQKHTPIFFTTGNGAARGQAYMLACLLRHSHEPDTAETHAIFFTTGDGTARGQANMLACLLRHSHEPDAAETHAIFLQLGMGLQEDKPTCLLACCVTLTNLTPQKHTPFFLTQQTYQAVSSGDHAK
jgi:hypothetical protein